MTWSFPIGRLLGSELMVHVTFFLLLIWIGANAWGMGGPMAAVIDVLFILVPFACVVAHEFGHALMARRYGIRTPDITLLPIGGLARLERMPERPGQEIAVALAGPAVNVVIAAALYIAGFGPTVSAVWMEGTLASFLGGVLSVNILLVVFNMVPAFPMDGGRVLRGVLSVFLPRLRATLVAVRIGQVFAVLFAAYGLWSGNVILGVIAVFVFLAGNGELAEMRARAGLGDLTVGDAMIADFAHLSSEAPMLAAAALARSSDQIAFPVLGPDGRLAGMVPRDALLAQAANAGSAARVAEIMQREVPQLPAHWPAGALLPALAEAPAIGVTGPSGRLVGIVTRDRAAALLRRRRPPQ